VITLTNINIRCNGLNEIQLFDQNGKQFYYCDTQPSTVIFVSTDTTWVGISKLGSMSYTMSVQFLNSYTLVTTTTSSTNSTTSLTTRTTTTTSSVTLYPKIVSYILFFILLTTATISIT
jgi:hypothetical protein